MALIKFVSFFFFNFSVVVFCNKLVSMHLYSKHDETDDTKLISTLSFIVKKNKKYKEIKHYEKNRAGFKFWP